MNELINNNLVEQIKSLLEASRQKIAVEVKTSGYLQTWEQKALSKPIFGIQPTFGWDSKTNEYEAEKKRQSDIYVFCVHAHTDQETADPLQICQWEFNLLPKARNSLWTGFFLSK